MLDPSCSNQGRNDAHSKDCLATDDPDPTTPRRHNKMFPILSIYRFGSNSNYWRPAIPTSLDFPLAYLSGLQGIDWPIAAGHFHSYADTRRLLPFVCSSSRSLPPVCRSDNRHLARLISHLYPPEGWGSSYQLIRSDVGCLATGDEVDLPPLARANTPQWR